MRNEAFYAFLSFTPWVSLLILALLALRRSKARLSARFYRVAWGLLALRCALPINLRLPQIPRRVEITLPTAPVGGGAMAAGQGANLVSAQILSTPGAVAGGNGAASQIVSHSFELAPAPQFSLSALLYLLGWLWLAGAVLFLAWRVASYLLFLLDLRRSRKPVTDDALLAIRDEVFGQQLPLYRSPAIGSPALVGLFGKKIYLPEGPLSPAALQMILEHEACHARRQDILLKWLLTLANAVCWCNPLVWWMTRAAEQDIECACDEIVLNGKDITYCKLYGSTILDTLRAQRRKTTLSTGFAGNTKDLKARFVAMFSSEKKRLAKPVTALLCVLILLASALFACTSAPQSSSAPEGPAISASEPSNAPLTATATVEDSYFDDAVFFGDSITYSFFNDPGSGLIAPKVVAELSVTPPIPGDLWVNRDTKDEYDPIEQVVSAAPQKIYLQFGTNQLAEQGEAGAKALLENYRVLIDTLQEKLPGCTLYLQSIPMVTTEAEETFPALTRAHLQNVNEQLSALAAQTGCYYLDLQSALCDSEGSLREKFAAEDGVHLTLEGYQVWFDYLKIHAATGNVAGGGLLFPVDADGYTGMNRAFDGAVNHQGIDLRGKTGTRIYAAADGTVTKAENSTSGYGNHLQIDHGGGLSTFYSHCKTLSVEEGAMVVRGQLIATLGSSGNSTGPHLHFEVRQDDIPVDPMDYFPSEAATHPALVEGLSAKVRFWPLPSSDRLITARFGLVTEGGSTRDHTGIDLTAGDSAETAGRSVVAVLPGTVSAVGDADEGGGYLVLDHGGQLKTVYAGLDPDRILVAEGSVVSAGDLLGHLGDSGNGAHLHFEVRQNDTPIDPLDYLPSEAATQPVSTNGTAHYHLGGAEPQEALTLLQQAVQEKTIPSQSTRCPSCNKAMEFAVLSDKTLPAEELPCRSRLHGNDERFAREIEYELTCSACGDQTDAETVTLTDCLICHGW